MSNNYKRIGSTKVSIHQSGQINKTISAPNSGTYRNQGGKETWKDGDSVFIKDANGVWRDKNGKYKKWIKQEVFMNREKSSEKSTYSVTYGNKTTRFERKIEQTREDNGEKNTYIKTLISTKKWQAMYVMATYDKEMNICQKWRWYYG